MNASRWARAQWDRVVAGALFAAGALALVMGWVGVSKEALTAAQIPYVISGGLGGIFLLGLGAVFWLSADLRDEWRKLDDIERADRNKGERVDTSEPTATDAQPGANGGTSRAAQRSTRRARLGAER